MYDSGNNKEKLVKHDSNLSRRGSIGMKNDGYNGGGSSPETDATSGDSENSSESSSSIKAFAGTVFDNMDKSSDGEMDFEEFIIAISVIS